MWKLAVLAAALAAIAAFNLGAPPLTAGPPSFVVNTTADDADADVGAPACDTGSGDCSLRAAIEQANEDGGGSVTFDNSVFPSGSPATIALDSSGNGELPTIVVPLTIDGSGAGVILEPADGSMLDYGLFVLDDTPGDATDFTIIGNSFTIRGFEETLASDEAEGDGIVVCGDSGDGCGSGPVQNVNISGLAINSVSGAAILVRGGDSSDVTVDDNDALAGGAEPAVDVRLGDGSTANVTNNASLAGDDDAADVRTGDGGAVTISGNGNIDAPDDGLKVRVGDTAHVDLNDNGDVTAADGDAITVDGGSDAEITIDSNGALTGGDNAIELNIGDDSLATIIDNGDLTSSTDPAIQLELGSDSLAQIFGHELITTSENAAIEVVLGDGSELVADGNEAILGASEGILVEGGSGMVVRVVNNDSIAGQDDNAIGVEGISVEIEISMNGGIVSAAGSGIEIDSGVTGAIEDNGIIAGLDGRGIDIDGAVESGGAVSELTISGNTIADSSEQGIRIKCETDDPVTCTGGTGTIISNNTISSNGLHGILIEEDVEVTVIDNTITGNGEAGVHLLNTSGNLVASNTIELNDKGVVVDDDGGVARGNTITRNSMSANDGIGIDLGDNGPSPNDPNDNDSGANDLLNTPTSLAFDYFGFLSGRTCASCLVEIFVVDSPPDESERGEGAVFIGDVVASAAGNFTFDIAFATIPCGLSAGLLTATATDGDGNTSEFSRNEEGFQGSPDCPATPTPPQTPTPTATPTVVVLADGDVNKDGATNSLDGLLVLQTVAGLLPNVPFPEHGDVDQDSDIDSIDAVLILQFDAGLIGALPV